MSTRTQQIDQDKWIEELVADHLSSAIKGVWDGGQLTPYFHSCRRQFLFRGMTTIFTRDTGHHTSGWWKNPDYERCYHLSVSYFDPATQEPRPDHKEVTKLLVSGFFTKHKNKVWVEPPYSEEGKKHGVYHYRLFCDEAWQPIKPRGEVYSRELTEAGWHSYSDVQDSLDTKGVNPNADMVRHQLLPLRSSKLHRQWKRL